MVLAAALRQTVDAPDGIHQRAHGRCQKEGNGNVLLRKFHRRARDGLRPLARFCIRNHVHENFRRFGWTDGRFLDMARLCRNCRPWQRALGKKAVSPLPHQHGVLPCYSVRDGGDFGGDVIKIPA